MVGGRAPLRRSWTLLRQVGRRPLARLARAYTDRGLPGRGAATGARPRPQHLVVLVHGLFGKPADWRHVVRELEAGLGGRGVRIFVSRANLLWRTFDGVDVCGARLAAEVEALVAAEGAGLETISIVGHSLGGLIGRYAAGVLSDEASRKMAGLQPHSFVTIATPHLGCDASSATSIHTTETMVPFLAWAAEAPAIGKELGSLVDRVAVPVSSTIFGRTGQQLFLEDRGGGRTGGGEGPLLLSLASPPAESSGGRDLPSGRFLAALASFEHRTCYASIAGDHMVSRTCGSPPPGGQRTDGKPGFLVERVDPADQRAAGAEPVRGAGGRSRRVRAVPEPGRRGRGGPAAGGRRADKDKGDEDGVPGAHLGGVADAGVAAGGRQPRKPTAQLAHRCAPQPHPGQAPHGRGPGRGPAHAGALRKARVNSRLRVFSIGAGTADGLKKTAARASHTDFEAAIHSWAM